MTWIKAAVRLIHAWRHPDEIAREVEEELRFHIAMRTRANIEDGMTPEEAQLAALQSFGDFARVKVTCCEISRSLPIDSRPLKMGMYIAIAIVAGGTALWAVNIPHHNLSAVLWQLVAIAVLARAFVVGRRSISTKRFAGDRAKDVFLTRSERLHEHQGVCEQSSVSIAPHDEQGHTPIERVFKSE